MTIHAYTGTYLCKPTKENPVMKGTYKTRWADVDANGHLRHSAYADFCAHARVEILEEMGLSVNKMREMAMGPILFREELVYKREVDLSEEIRIETFLAKARKDAAAIA